MESNMTADEVDTHLSELWRQAAQDVAVQMVRVSIQKDISLEALRRALDHAAKHADLTQVHMRDVMAAKAASAPAQAGAAGQAPKAANPPRSRRKPEITAAIRAVLLDSLQSSRNGLITPELGEAVRGAGHAVGNQKINLVLNAMERSNMVECDDGRPKTWRIKAPRGRTAAEPVVIRRAAPRPEEETDPATLMSHQEIKAAAANLRDRFFAQ